MWKLIVRAVSAVWKGLGVLRQALGNLLVLALVVALAVALGDGGAPKVRPHSTLVVTIAGNVVERTRLSDREAAVEAVLSGEQPQTCLHDVLDALELAREDADIDGVLIKVDGMTRAGLAGAHAIGEAMDRFRSSGKRIVVWASSYSQAQYAVASHANEVYLHPMGSVMLTGLGNSRLYWGEALKRLGVKVHVFKSGAYKSFPEVFIRKSPSPEALEADQAWMGDAWNRLTQSMQNARGLMPGRIDRLIAESPKLLEHHAGDWAAVASDANLIDGVKTADQVRRILMERQGVKAEDALRTIGFLDYLDARVPSGEGRPGVAMLVLEGEVHDAQDGMGRIGATSAVRLIEQAGKDGSVRALVVRVNSPGGSALASEKIRHALEQVKASGKPVVVSMGDMAASGGYWLSLGASKVVADPLTLTGSIGVFGMLPTFEEALARFDIGVGGTSTGWLAPARNPMRAVDPRFGKLLTLSVERTYRDFVALVARARGLRPDDAERLAQGRVYTGAQAFSHRLVDALGGVGTAQRMARELAGLPTDAPLYWFDEEPSTWRAWFERMLLRTGVRLLPQAVLARWFPMQAEVPSPLLLMQEEVWAARPLAHSLLTSGF